MALDAARLEGRGSLTTNDIPYNAYGVKGLMAKGYIASSNGGGYHITEAGTRALINPDQPVKVNGAVKISGDRPYTPPIAKPVTNGQAAPSPCLGRNGEGSCPHKRVLEIIAPYVPEAAQLLAALESIERRVK